MCPAWPGTGDIANGAARKGAGVDIPNCAVFQGMAQCPAICTKLGLSVGVFVWLNCWLWAGVGPGWWCGALCRGFCGGLLMGESVLSLSRNVGLVATPFRCREVLGAVLGTGY